jgi:hypothetical protein
VGDVAAADDPTVAQPVLGADPVGVGLLEVLRQDRGPRLGELQDHLIPDLPVGHGPVEHEGQLLGRLEGGTQGQLLGQLQLGGALLLGEIAAGGELGGENGVERGARRCAERVAWREDDAGVDLLEGPLAVVDVQRVARQVAEAEGDAVGDVHQRADVEAVAGGAAVHRGVGEVGTVGDAQVAEGDAGLDFHLRQVESLVQLQVRHVDVEPGAEAEAVGDLVGDGRLNEDVLDLAAVGAEAAGEEDAVLLLLPLGREAVGREDADACRQPLAEPVAQVQRRHRVVVAFEVAGASGVGLEAADRVDEGGANRDLGLSLLELGQAGRVVDHRGAVVTGGGNASAGTPHGAGAVLVDAEPLGRSETGGPCEGHQCADGRPYVEPPHRSAPQEGVRLGERMRGRESGRG